MKSYSIETLAAWLNVKPVLSKHGYQFVKELLYDSRRINQPETSLFVALRTDRNDGHRFIPELIRKGVMNFLVEVQPESSLAQQANFLIVPDSLKAFQKLAAMHRKRFNLPVIGITGSNGKTIVKEWLNQLLESDFKVVRSPKSFNSQIGVPVSVWKLDEETTLGIFEAGISMPSEMETLEEIIRPTIGIFTNAGTAHSENFTAQVELIAEKAKLFIHSETIFYCRDHTAIHEILEKAVSGKKISWGCHPDSTLTLINSEKYAGFTNVEAQYEGNSVRFNIPFQDEASLENLLHCILVMLDFGKSEEVINDRIRQLHALEMRLEINRAIHNSTLINDAYSADTESLRIALDVMLDQRQHQKRTVIISDLPSVKENAAESYCEIAALFQRKQVDRVIGVGKVIASHAAVFKGEKLFFQTTDALLQHLPEIGFRDECILLKGARVFGFERLADALQQKTHETVLEINLTAVVSNLNFYRSKLNPGVKLMAMVKAFSYGAGSYEIANTLQFNGVDYLAVAYADEGLELRNAGISLPVMVMNPEVDSFAAMIENRLEPEIYSFRILDAFSEAVQNRHGFDGQPLRIHIKLDTGMHRLGFEEKDLELLLQKLEQLPQLEVASVFSHLAGSADSEFDSFTAEQIRKFDAWTALLEEELKVPFLKHLLNSSGIVRHRHAQYNMARLGIGLYGIGESEEQSSLADVSCLKTIISQLRVLEAGETVGYSRKGAVNRRSIIATLPIGYADGFSRKLGNGAGTVRIGGINASTIGNICMDMCMVDVTAIPDVREGDQVVIFENAGDIHTLAQQMGTIPYEVLTAISARVKRVYFQE